MSAASARRATMLGLATALLGMGAAAAAAQTDTTLAVAAGGRLILDASRAAVQVRAWDRAAVRVVAPAARGALRIERTADTLRISLATRGADSTFEITLPRPFAIELSGRQVSVSIDGVDGDIAVETLLGDVDVRGGAGPLRAETLTGLIHVEGRRGSIDAESSNLSIQIADCEGAIRASSVNGEIRLIGNRSASIHATSVNGGIEFDGGALGGGEYDLTTHNGSITLGLSAGSDVDVEATALMGSVQADMPVELRSTRDGRYRFTLGAGGARIHAQTFSGDIRIRRPGPRRPADN